MCFSFSALWNTSFRSPTAALVKSFSEFSDITILPSLVPVVPLSSQLYLIFLYRSFACAYQVTLYQPRNFQKQVINVLPPEPSVTPRPNAVRL